MYPSETQQHQQNPPDQNLHVQPPHQQPYFGTDLTSVQFGGGQPPPTQFPFQPHQQPQYIGVGEGGNNTAATMGIVPGLVGQPQTTAVNPWLSTDEGRIQNFFAIIDECNSNRNTMAHLFARDPNKMRRFYHNLGLATLDDDDGSGYGDYSEMAFGEGGGGERRLGIRSRNTTPYSRSGSTPSLLRASSTRSLSRNSGRRGTFSRPPSRGALSNASANSAHNLLQPRLNITAETLKALLPEFFQTRDEAYKRLDELRGEGGPLEGHSSKYMHNRYSHFVNTGKLPAPLDEINAKQQEQSQQPPQVQNVGADNTDGAIDNFQPNVQSPPIAAQVLPTDSSAQSEALAPPGMNAAFQLNPDQLLFPGNINENFDFGDEFNLDDPDPDDPLRNLRFQNLYSISPFDPQSSSNVPGCSNWGGSNSNDPNNDRHYP